MFSSERWEKRSFLERQIDVSNEKRNLFDDIVEGTRRILEDLDRVLNPEKHAEKQQQPVPVPVDRQHDRHNDPYR